ncbi:MAG: exodeoxyribonuclease V subunit alpha, partial [Deltaproteobacteria bacterium]|nr:exodeoxyribonuclease V subunit alpha [Deltaproteobacteria bacterium]
MSHEVITYLYSIGKLAPLDVHFAGLLARLNKRSSLEVELAAAMTSWYTRQGHICMDLARLIDIHPVNGSDIIRALDVAAWRQKLVQSRVVGRPGEYKPLILDQAGRLYLYRYWEYQKKLADALKARLDESSVLPEANVLRDGIERLFPAQGSEVDYQKVAAFAAVSKKLCVISGGPGTGKTTTVAKILALLLESTTKDGLHLALAAPTGKAAARLQEAINQAKQTFNCSDRIKQAIPETASTLHRLLGSLPRSPYFRYNETNLLHLDVLVVDEASMVDLALMSKLLQALHPDTRLILLGDKDQLSSVEAGAVLGDICGGSEPGRFSQSFASACQEICGCRLARLVDFLSTAGVKTISFDIGFFEPDEKANLPILQSLREKMKNLGAVPDKLQSVFDQAAKEMDTDRQLADSLQKSKSDIVLGYFFHMSSQGITHLTPDVIKRRIAETDQSKYKLIRYQSQKASTTPFAKA